MIILGIDTSTKVSTVAILKDNILMSEIIMQNKLAQSEVLLGHIQDALRIAKIEKNEIDAIAVSIGPGSFTGLRIGLCAAKMMAYALNIPLISISSLKVLAYHHLVANIYIASVMDAQKKNAYIEIYEWVSDELKIVRKLDILPFTDILEICNKLSRPVILSGDMAQKYHDKVGEYQNIILAKPHQIMPRAANVAILAAKDYIEGEFSNIMAAEPLYIRKSEAEVLWEKRQNLIKESIDD